MCVFLGVALPMMLCVAFDRLRSASNFQMPGQGGPGAFSVDSPEFTPVVPQPQVRPLVVPGSHSLAAITPRVLTKHLHPLLPGDAGPVNDGPIRWPGVPAGPRGRTVRLNLASRSGNLGCLPDLHSRGQALAKTSLARCRLASQV